MKLDARIHSIFFVSDTHFGHRAMSDRFRVGKYPYDVPTSAHDLADPAYHQRSRKDAMDAHMIELWNRTVPKHGIVFHLGDVAFRNRSEWFEIFEQLNGEIHLRRGNHDGKLNTDGFASVADYSELTVRLSEYEEQRLVLAHYALRSWNRMHYGAWNLHGHSHGNLSPIGRQLDVGVDCTLVTPELRPISFAEVAAYMAGRDFVAVDHHVAKAPSHVSTYPEGEE